MFDVNQVKTYFYSNNKLYSLENNKYNIGISKYPDFYN